MLNESNQAGEKPSIGQTFCGDTLRYASLLGLFLGISQQLTGINVVMFYSSDIFKGTSMSIVWVNFLVYGVNLLATLGSVFLLGWFGRKTLMMLFVPLQAAMMICLGLFLGWLKDDVPDMLSVVSCLLFVAFFEFSSGPIVWLYIAEICNDTAQSMATVAN